MRVLVITNMYPPHHYGGYELSCQEAVEFLRSRGDDVLVLTSDIEVPGVTANELTPGVRRDLRMYWDDHVVLRPSVRESLRIERHNQRVLAQAFDDHAPDVVSVWAMGCMSLGLIAACRERDVPIVSVVCDDWMIYGPLVDRWARTWRRLGPAAAAAERLFSVPCRLPDLGRNDTYCFVSEYTKSASEKYGGWSFDEATVVYSGINTDDFPVSAPRDEPWSGRLLHVGRIDERKGIDVAVRALRALDDTTVLDVVGRGDDSYLMELDSLVRSLGMVDRVRFSVAERRELAAIYTRADAVIFTPRWAEPFGLVPLEAMACATPVIATGVGGSAEFLVHERNCLRVPVDDEHALAEAVRRLADDPQLRDRLVAGGLVTAAELTLARWLDSLVAWHDATAVRFRDGRPPDRLPIEQVLSQRFADG